MISPHQQFYIPTATPIDVIQSARLLCDPTAPPETRSWGRVTQDATFEKTGTIANGIYCERIFGPARDDHCRCGKFQSPESRGVVCDKCGVLVERTSVRKQRWAHIEVAEGLLHPVLVPTIARALDCSEREVVKRAGSRLSKTEAAQSTQRSVVESLIVPPVAVEPSKRNRTFAGPSHFATGIVQLQAQLVKARCVELESELSAHGVQLSDLILHVIPVPPAGLRPIDPQLLEFLRQQAVVSRSPEEKMLASLFGETHTTTSPPLKKQQKAPRIPAFDSALRSIIRADQSLRHYRQTGAPVTELSRKANLLQRRFTDLLKAADFGWG